METNEIPPVLLFRIESSILQDAQVQEIILPSQALMEDGGMGTTSTLVTRNAVGRENPTRVSTRLESAGPLPVHVFYPSNTLERATDISSEQNNDWLYYQGSTTTSAKRVVIQTAKELKKLGTKARARLEEEKMKRPEIQILDQVQTSDPEKNKTRKTTSFSTNISSQKVSTTAASGTKRRLDLPSRKKPSQQPITKKQRTTTTSQSNYWVPDVSHIVTPEKEQQSATVKLHGIPVHCTTEQVKKFFAGLPVEKVTILLPNDITIKALDAVNLPHRHHRQVSGSIDLRLRVLVTFASSSAAALASDRSGETMTIRDHDQEETFVVAITILSKELAHALSLVVSKCW